MDQVLAWLQASPPEWVLPLSAAVAFVETLFPPFPGDVAFAALCGWAARTPSSAAAFAACGAAGCAAASVILLCAGRMLGRGRVRSILSGRRWSVLLGRAERMVERRGVSILLLGRFVPGLRSFLVLAAGYTGGGIAAGLAAAAGALLWYGLLSAAGHAAGANIEPVRQFLSRWGIASWAVLAAAGALWGAFLLARPGRGRG